jgi:tetratricopeptide (TPR) repeat protein
LKHEHAVSAKRLARLRSHVEEQPGSAKAHMQYGTALYWNGEMKHAEQELKRAIELDEEYAEAWVQLGGIYLACWDFDSCIDVNLKAAKINPELMEAYYNMGLGHLYLNQPDEMVACFRRVLEIAPEHAGGHYHLAVGLLALGESETAHAELANAVDLGYAPQPEFVKALDRAVTGRSGVRRFGKDNKDKKLH